MKRRGFIKGLLASLVAAPVVAEAVANSKYVSIKGLTRVSLDDAPKIGTISSGSLPRLLQEGVQDVFATEIKAYDNEWTNLFEVKSGTLR